MKGKLEPNIGEWMRASGKESFFYESTMLYKVSRVFYEKKSYRMKNPAHFAACRGLTLN